MKETPSNVNNTRVRLKVPFKIVIKYIQTKGNRKKSLRERIRFCGKKNFG